MVSVAFAVSSSFLATTVTIWPTFQLAALKVSVPVTVRSLPASVPGVTVTLPVGSVRSLTV